MRLKKTTKLKFGNKKTTMCGMKFDSRKEAERYCVLRALEKEGRIHELVRQPEFILQEKFTDSKGIKRRAIKYIADFQYRLNQYMIVEDVKSKATKTAAYEIKKKLLLKMLPDGWVFNEIL